MEALDEARVAELEVGNGKTRTLRFADDLASYGPEEDDEDVLADECSSFSLRKLNGVKCQKQSQSKDRSVRGTEENALGALLVLFVVNF